MRARSRWPVALVAVFATLLLPAGPAAAAPSGRAWLALGDSFSSGEGVPGTTTDCARALGDLPGYAMVAYQAVRVRQGFGSIDFVACTGATTTAIEGQITEAERSGRRAWDVVTLSIGGNDLDFDGIIVGCLDAVGWGQTGVRAVAQRGGFLKPPAGGCDITDEEITKRIDDLVQDVLPDVYDRVAELVRPGGAVVVVGYPQLFEEVDRWDTWRRNLLRNCEGIRAEDVPLVRRIADQLNTKLRGAVEQADRKAAARGVRMHYLDLVQLYEPPGSDDRHGVCSTSPWLNGITVRGRHQRTFHPNGAGHAATGAALAELFGSTIRFDDAPRRTTPLHRLTTGYQAVGPSGIAAPAATGAPATSTNFWVGCDGRPAETYFGLNGTYREATGRLSLAGYTPADLLVSVELVADGRSRFREVVRVGQQIPVRADVSGAQQLVLRAQAIQGVCTSAPTGYGLIGDAVVTG